MNFHLLTPFSLAAVLLASGCAQTGPIRGSRQPSTYPRTSGSTSRSESSFALPPTQGLPPSTPAGVQDDNYSKTMSAIEGLDLRIESIRQDVQRMSVQAGAVSPADVRAIQDRLARMERELEEMKAAQARDQDALLRKVSEQVNKTMKEVLASQPAPSRSSGGSPGSGSSGGGSRAPAGAAVERGWEHTVEPGQTISAIAVAYGSTTQGILKANNLKNADSIRVGQKLFIPAPAP